MGWGVFIVSYRLLYIHAFLYASMGVHECPHACNQACMAAIVRVPFILQESLRVFGGA